MGKRQQSSMIKGERADVKRHQDNLKLEGSFESRQKAEAVIKGERAEVQRHQDNFKIEGTFEGRLKNEALSGKIFLFRQF